MKSRLFVFLSLVAVFGSGGGIAQTAKASSNLSLVSGDRSPEMWSGDCKIFPSQTRCEIMLEPGQCNLSIERIDNHLIFRLWYSYRNDNLGCGAQGDTGRKEFFVHNGKIYNGSSQIGEYSPVDRSFTVSWIDFNQPSVPYPLMVRIHAVLDFDSRGSSYVDFDQFSTTGSIASHAVLKKENRGLVN